MSNSLVEYNQKGLNNGQVNMQAYGYKVYFPKNATLRLMYYLSSVATVLPNLKDPNFLRLTKYNEFAQLTAEDKRSLLKWCVACAPENLIDRVFFFNEKIGTKNMFYKVDSNTEPMLININGSQIQVTNLMHLRRSWLKEFYVEPLQEIIGEIYKPTISYHVCTII